MMGGGMMGGGGGMYHAGMMGGDACPCEADGHMHQYQHAMDHEHGECA